MAGNPNSGSKASLGDPGATGGLTALKGFDFQRAYALILLVESIRDPDFTGIILEGAEDVEVRFDREGIIERRAVQVKSYRVTMALAKKIIARFVELDKTSPGTWTWFVIACTGLDGTLQTIHNLLTSYRKPQGFYDAVDDGILANTRAVLEHTIADAGLPVGFLIERVTFEPGLPDLTQLQEWVRPRVLHMLQTSYSWMNHTTAKEIYFRLIELISKSTRKSITRQQVESLIEATMPPATALPELKHLVSLIQTLATRFDTEDLRTLCFSLGVDYDDLPAEGKANRARELVKYLERRDQIPDLIEAGRELRPDVSWSDIPEVIGAAPSAFRNAPPEWLLPRHFIGRRHHLDVLKDALTADNGAALIALQGMGGVGKTAIALKLAVELSPQFPGGVFWGALADYDGSARPILRNWAQSCGRDLSAEGDPDSLVHQVQDLLADHQADYGQLLIIIDDVRREWLDATQFLKRALPTSVPLLLTTRDETLAAVLEADVHRLDTLPDDESLDLLKAHAGATVVDANLAEAKALLRAIGYLPLAIRLAGKRLALLARKPGYRLEKLRQAIEERAFQVLTLPGHPGLKAIFDVTFESLPSDRQRLFRWLGVFASGSIRVAAVAGVMGLDEMETESALDELVLLSLLDWSKTAGTYVLHPLLRQYAQALLTEAGEADEAEQLHMAYYLTFAQANVRAEPDAWDRLEEELPNLLLAATRAAEARDITAVVSFEEALLHESKFLYVRGHYQEIIDVFSQSLAVQEALGVLKHQPRTLNKLAYFRGRLGQLEKAQEIAEKAGRLARDLGDQEQQADSLYYLGIALDGQGKRDSALECFERELETRRRIGNLPRLANCLNSLGLMQETLGEYAEAIRYIDEAATIYEQLGDEKGVAQCISNRGVPELYMGDYAKAMEDFEAGLDKSRGLNYREIIAQNLINKGILQSYRGDYSSALQSLEASSSLYQQLGDAAGAALACSAMAEIHTALGDCQRAVEYLHIAEEELRRTGDKDVEIEYLNVLGTVHCDQGDYEESLADFLRMESLTREAKSAYFLVQSKLGLARTCLARGGAGHLTNARRHAEEAVNLCQELRLAGSEPRGHAYLGQADLLLGDREGALSSCQVAIHLLDSQKFVHGSEAEIYLIALKILQANGLEDERQRCLERAYDLVRATAARIEEEAWRRSYLAVPINREILETWARERAGKID